MNSFRSCIFIFIAHLLISTVGNAAQQENAPNLVGHFSKVLAPISIDVRPNLNNIDWVNSLPVNPALGRLLDIPVGEMPSRIELDDWELAFKERLILGLPLINLSMEDRSNVSFKQLWYEAHANERIFITYSVANHQTINEIILALEPIGYFTDTGGVQNPGEFYATSGNRWVLDSQQARKIQTRVLEISLLGKPQLKDRESVFPANGEGSRYYAADEPERFKNLEMGDELVQASIPEVRVIGGIGFGETANMDRTPLRIEYRKHEAQGRLYAIFDGGGEWNLPLEDPRVLKSCFDFAMRSLKLDSDAAVDIGKGGKVKISQAFKHTDLGFDLVKLDQQPFKVIRNIKERKSILLDTLVFMWLKDKEADLITNYEVRFVGANRQGLADTRAAFQFEYNSGKKVSSFTHRWGVSASKVKSRTLDKLAKATENFGRYAGWVAFFKAIKVYGIDFSRGRYQFLKINTEGKVTPTRVR